MLLDHQRLAVVCRTLIDSHCTTLCQPIAVKHYPDSFLVLCSVKRCLAHCENTRAVINFIYSRLTRGSTVAERLHVSGT